MKGWMPDRWSLHFEYFSIFQQETSWAQLENMCETSSLGRDQHLESFLSEVTIIEHPTSTQDRFNFDKVDDERETPKSQVNVLHPWDLHILSRTGR